ncbi:hypothetical protein [Pseudoalteromonas sp. TB64]|uniref:hypothetical protein n=1 Tax=Pseudoalteromonas sp. TB64 TaxID=1938600 RepID=UPI0004145B07|nr:hypothetical protein [Pseudoalteromonas sp. TB64]
MNMNKIFTCVFLLITSHVSIASDCLSIKVIEPIKVNDKTERMQSIKFDKVKLLHKDKSGICLPTQDTYVLAFNEGVPFITARLKGHTPDITLIEKNDNDYALIKYYAGNKLQVLKGYQLIGSELYELPNFTLSSNVSSINIIDGLINVENNELVEEKPTNSVTLYDFSLSGVFIKP